MGHQHRLPEHRRRLGVHPDPDETGERRGDFQDDRADPDLDGRRQADREVRRRRPVSYLLRHG